MTLVVRSTRFRFNVGLLDPLLLPGALDTASAMRFLYHVCNMRIPAFGPALLASKAFGTGAVAFGLLDGTGFA